MQDESDLEPTETREWTEAIASVIAFEGTARADELLTAAVDTARRSGARLPFAANTAYVNTISVDEQGDHPGNRELENRIRSVIRWNAAAIVLKANKTSSATSPRSSRQRPCTTRGSRISGTRRTRATAAISSSTRGTPRPAFTHARSWKAASPRSS